MVNKTKQHRLDILQRAEDNLNFVIDMIILKQKAIKQIRELGYSKKRSVEILNEIILKI